jgi:integrase
MTAYINAPFVVQSFHQLILVKKMNEKTKSDYIKLADNFYKTRLKNEDITPKKITDALKNAAYDYRPDYFRKLRNALAFDQESKGFKKSADRINETKNPLTAADAPLMLKRQIKPKQKRVKKIVEADYNKVLSKLSKNDKELKAALTIADLVGCRPAEMLNIEINMPYEILIRGAKKTEKNERGLDRKLTMNYQDVFDIQQAVSVLKAGDTDDYKTDIMHRIQTRLDTLTKSVFPRRKSQMTLYSFRHQLGANLKASGLDRVTVAYMMGHQSTKSIGVYGDKRTSNGNVNIKPSISLDEQKQLVRENHKEIPNKLSKNKAPVHQKSQDFTL